MKSLARAFGLLWLMFFCTSALAQNEICVNAHSCESLGLDAMRKNDLAAARNFFEQAVGYAEDASDKLGSIKAYNNMTLLFIKMHDYENALKWVQVTLTVDPLNKLASNYFKQIVASYRALRSNKSVSGTYVKYAGRNYWDRLKVEGNASKSYKFDLTLYRIGPTWRKYGPSQVGEAHGLLEKHGRYGFVYNGDEDFSSCRIYFKFDESAVVINQDNDCGFGYGLRADGTLKRIAN